MGQVIDFETGAVAQLRERVARAEEDSGDLLAFARGHAEASAAIHRATLAAIETEGLDHLLHVVTRDWPGMLGVDAVALALTAGERAIRADRNGMQFVERRLVERAVEDHPGVTLRSVAMGHPLFGGAGDSLRAEALIGLDNDPPLPTGLLLLGQRESEPLDVSHGTELLGFLGQSLARLIGRWLLP